MLKCFNLTVYVYDRRRPKRQLEREKKRRLQQRLNSLSFYDSIPLYDSLGRRAGAGQSNTSLVNISPIRKCCTASTEYSSWSSGPMTQYASSFQHRFDEDTSTSY